MNYIFKDRLSDFEFHDSLWRLISFDAGVMKFKVKFLNVHKEALKKYFEKDMEIREAYMTITGVSVITFEEGEKWKQNGDGNLDRVKEPNIHTEEAAETFFISEFKDGAVVLEFNSEGTSITVSAAGNEPFFISHFTYESVKIEWDEFRGDAWYERMKNT